MTLRLNGDGSGFTEIKAADTAGDNSIKLPASNGSANQLLQNGGTAGELQYTSAGGGLQYDSSGRLLVGTSTSPSAGSGQYARLASIGNTAASTGDGRLVLARGLASASLSSGQDIGGVEFTDNTGAAFAAVRAQTDGVSGGANGNPGRLSLFTEDQGSDDGPSERLRITNNGTIRLLNSPGIDFSGISTSSGAATPDNNLLDDYEEGTWTPGIEGGSTAGSYTVSDVEAYYTKIGKRVMATCRFKTTEVSAGTGYAKITGLPFNYKAGTRDIGAASFRFWTSGASSPVGCGVANIGSGVDNRVLIIIAQDNNTDYKYLPITGLGSPNFNLISLTYIYEEA